MQKDYIEDISGAMNTSIIRVSGDLHEDSAGVSRLQLRVSLETRFKNKTHERAHWRLELFKYLG